jgi:Protein of unknown function (DUF2384)
MAPDKNMIYFNNLRQKTDNPTPERLAFPGKNDYIFFLQKGTTMPTALAARASATDAAIVTKALVRAAKNLKLANTAIGGIVGLSDATISRMKRGAYVLTPGEKPFELAVLFVRMYRSLTAIVGGDDQVARAWLDNENVALHARPIERIQSVSGLVDVINYLDARRAVV